MEGAALIAALNGRHTMREEIRLLRSAQAYSVSVYAQDFKRLSDANALYAVGESGAIALGEGYYDEESGLLFDQSSSDLLIF